MFFIPLALRGEISRLLPYAVGSHSFVKGDSSVPPDPSLFVSFDSRFETRCSSSRPFTTSFCHPERSEGSQTVPAPRIRIPRRQANQAPACRGGPLPGRLLASSLQSVYGFCGFCGFCGRFFSRAAFWALKRGLQIRKNRNFRKKRKKRTRQAMEVSARQDAIIAPAYE